MKHRSLKKTIRRNMLHPLHWHTSMFVAIAAILLTSFKTSGEMVRSLHDAPTHTAHSMVMESLHLRDAETGHAPIMVAMSRHAVTSGS